MIVWSDEYTGFYGAISARGGAAGGNGGFVETSSKDNLQAFGAVDAAAPAGRAGEWLLDPRNVTIANAANSNGAFGGGSPNVFTPVGDSAVADRNTIQTSLNAGTSVTITTGATGTQAGDIVVQDAVSKTTTTGAPTLTLNAAGGIAVNSAISGSAANRVLNVDMNAGAGITFGAGGSIVSRNGAVTMTAGSAIALGAVNSGTGALSVTAGGPITQNAGTALTTTGVTTLARGRGERHHARERDEQLRQRARREREQRFDPRQLGVLLRRRDFKRLRKSHGRLERQRHPGRRGHGHGRGHDGNQHAGREPRRHAQPGQ